MLRANLTASAHLGILMKSADELSMGALLRLPLTRVTTVKIGIRFGELLRFRRPCATVLASLLFLIPSLAGAESIARHWNDELLDAIRVDFARPTVHARNLFHVSVAMWDAWAAYDSDATTYLHHEKALQIASGRGRPVGPLPGVDDARAETISYAAYRILSARFANSPGAAESLVSFDAKMDELGYDREFTSTAGDSPAALGNRIAQTVLEFGASDNSNEAGGFANLHYTPLNPPLVPALPGNPNLLNPNRWQPLALGFFVDQGGNIILGGFPEALSPEWGQVRAFALDAANLTIFQRDNFDYWVFHDPGPPPMIGTPTEEYYKWGFEMVALWSGHLDPASGAMIDISPGAIGNSPLPDPGDYEDFYDFEGGGDWGVGHPVNPVTGKPYEPQIVPLGDYTRVLAEFWADGPDSETLPGHWFTIANYVSDHQRTQKRLNGRGSSWTISSGTSKFTSLSAEQCTTPLSPLGEPRVGTTTCDRSPRSATWPVLASRRIQTVCLTIRTACGCTREKSRSSPRLRLSRESVTSTSSATRARSHSTPGRDPLSSWTPQSTWLAWTGFWRRTGGPINVRAS